MSSQIRLLHEESFRLAAVFALLFLVLSGVLMGSVYWILGNTQRSALLEVVAEDISTVINGYRSEADPEAIEVIHQRLGASETDLTLQAPEYIVLEDLSGNKLAGNLPVMPPRIGVFELPLPASAHSREHPPRAALLGQGMMLAPGRYLFVAQDTTTIAVTHARILKAFSRTTAGALLLAILGGALSSVRFMHRIDAMSKTCNAIVEGRYSDRIALRGSGDELDRLASAINHMLDRISTLVESLRQISSDVAHDLRTPLTRMRQRLEATQSSSVTLADYERAVTIALADTDQLLVMFSALLRISQIEAGTRTASFTRFSLSEQLHRISEMFIAVAEDQGRAFSYTIAPQITLLGDPELLTQLFVNLIENALHHTEPGTPIEVKLLAGVEGVRVVIADHGPGIPMEEREKVFRRFYRLSASRSSSGTGLGLSMVAAIAQLHHAEISLLDNHPGLRVEVRFPSPRSRAAGG